jgi:hypothetical protein
MNSIMQRKPLAQIGKKLPKCAWCKEEFIRERPGMRVCSVACGIEKARAGQIKKACAPYRSKPVRKVQDRQWWLDATQVDVNRWCRWRDRCKPCITCGKPPESDSKHLKGSGRDAGHYLPRSTYGALRFDTRQIHAQCVTCNQYNSGRRHEYRLAMIQMHGPEFVEWLETQRQVKRWEIDELKEIRSRYSQLLRDSQRECDV